MTNSVSFLHLNIQSIVPKLDFIVAEYSCHDILFTESWLKPDISTDSLELPGYKSPYRRDRVDRLEGSVVVFVKDEINCVTRLDLHVSSVECIGLKSRLIIRNTYMDLFYIPPNSGQQIWEELEQSIDLALNSNHDIIITGDFSINQLGNNTTKTDNLLAQFSFHQLITEPTYVTERSSSLLDLVLVNNPHSILYSEVGPPLLDQTRYHMPIIGVLNHPIKSHSSYKRKVFYIRQG